MLIKAKKESGRFLKSFFGYRLIVELLSCFSNQCLITDIVETSSI